MKKIFLTSLFIIFALNASSFSKMVKTPKTVSPLNLELANLKAIDYPYDKGGASLVIWDINPMEDDSSVYQVFISTISEKSGWIKAVEFNSKENIAKDINLPFWAWDRNKNIHAVKLELNNILSSEIENLDFYTKVVLVKDKKSYESKAINAVSYSNWFRLDRLNNLIMLILMTVVFFLAVSHAKRKGLFIRRIAGLDAIEEAIGRATEMGKPIFYVPGIGSMSNISTIASTFILGEVSKKVAQYDSYIKVPHYDPIVMTVSKEIVKQSYIEAERPDSYREDINMFISSDQFSYAASIDGMMTREKPAACFFMGYFMAESLLLSEVGSSVGAIQIAGTDVDHQLPFFFTACDYTLIGEELYAAGAYLSKEPMLLSVLKVQDFGKLVFMVSVLIFSILLLISAKLGWHNATDNILNILRVY